MGTYTVTILELSQTAFDEIKGKLVAAGYHHAFDNAAEHPPGDSEVIDLNGIAVAVEKEGESDS